MQVSGCGFRDAGLRSWISGRRSQDAGFWMRVSGRRSQVVDLGTQVSGCRFLDAGFGTQVSGRGSRDAGLRMQGPVTAMCSNMYVYDSYYETSWSTAHTCNAFVYIPYVAHRSTFCSHVPM